MLVADLEKTLREKFGCESFRPGQLEAITALLDGRDVLGIMPTGAGKSLCFQLPAAILPGTAVVVSPLLALMKDQVDSLRARGIPAAAYNSMLSGAERIAVEAELASGRLRLIYIAPERLQQSSFLRLLSKIPISFLAIDEAHCISHWGHDFRPDYRRLGELRSTLKGKEGSRVPTIALTATATRRVQDDIVLLLEMRQPERVVTGFRRRNLAFEVRQCSGRAEKASAMKELIAEARAEGGSVVIYAATRKNVERVAGELGREAAHYHAGLDDDDREQAQEDFVSGKARVLVATNAFGMGIDKADVRAVIHYDIPGSVEAYYQEAGRAGRDGKPARCVLLFNHADVATQEFFIENLGDESSEVSRTLLKQLVRYAYSTECRQKLVLEYFGDPEADRLEGCGNCDRCQPKEADLQKMDELTSIASRQALAAVARVNGRFGKLRICEILKGSESAQVIALGLQSLPTYGLLHDWSIPSIRELVDLLAGAGYLKITGLEYPVLALSPRGLQAMKGEIPIELRRAPREAAAHHAPASRSRRASESGAEPGGGDPKLVEALRAFRTEEAKRAKVPPYVIFHDKTLHAISRDRPSAEDALEAIPGLGPKKIEKYGSKILEIVRSLA
jgi:ATP-dependent DNA helicase RecQ